MKEGLLGAFVFKAAEDLQRTPPSLCSALVKTLKECKYLIPEPAPEGMNAKHVLTRTPPSFFPEAQGVLQFSCTGLENCDHVGAPPHVNGPQWLPDELY